MCAYTVKMWHCTNVTLQLYVRANLWMTVTAPNHTPRSQRGCGKAVLSKIIVSIPSVYYMTNLQCRVRERTTPPRFSLCIWLARSTAGILCFHMWLTCHQTKKPKGHLYKKTKKQLDTFLLKHFSLIFLFNLKLQYEIFTSLSPSQYLGYLRNYFFTLVTFSHQ